MPKNVDEIDIEKLFWKSYHAQSLFQNFFFYFIERWIFAQNYKFDNKNDLLCTWRDFKENLSGGCRYDKLEIKACGLGSRIRDMEADLIYW